MRTISARSGENASGCPEFARTSQRSGSLRLASWTAVASGLAFTLAIGTPSTLANEETPLTYPHTKSVDTVEQRFGVAVPDPYRWLEEDARVDGDVREWALAQNEVSARYLEELPERAVFRERLAALFDHERLTVPEKRGGRYFHLRNAGLDRQPRLFVREGVNGSDRLVIDPNVWSENGTTALAEWSPSEDGTHLAFAVAEDGSDWRTIRVLDVESGEFLDDKIERARFTSIAWLKDGSGFFYARNLPPAQGDAGSASGHGIHFHKLGTPQEEDTLVYGPPSDLPLIHMVDVTPDGRYAVISSTALSGGNTLVLLDLADPAWPARSLATSLDHAWSVVGNVGPELFLFTQKGAERGKIVTADLTERDPTFNDLVAEDPDAVIFEAAHVGDRLLISTMVDATTRVRRYRLDGTPDGLVELPGIGSAGRLRGEPGDDEAFFLFTSLNTPLTVLRHEVETNTTSVWAEPKVAADLDGIVVEQRFFASKDGTRVPIFLARRGDVGGPAPTLLTAYGGYGIPMIPTFSPEAIAWIEQGGVFALANIRGGGEYGRAWHDAGRLRNKQNVFDDFIAAAEFLKTEEIAASDGLAIQGGSNGGLLIGAVVNQRPDLFAAALPDVGVLDMLRFDRFTGGPLWIQEYGDPSVEADFRDLLAYSPLHNVRPGAEYPAILVTTADTDDRVVPAHSFKYAAALQAADLGQRPRLLRVETEAGHGAGKPTDKMIEERADMWAFAARWTGLGVEESR